MASHTAHPKISEAGLRDGCPRCDEYAARPFDNFDDENLWELAQGTLRWMRDEQDAFPRSSNEHAAMMVMERAIIYARTLKRLGVIE